MKRVFLAGSKIVYGNIFVHFCCRASTSTAKKGPVSMTCTMGVDVTGVNRKSLHLVFPLFELSLQMSGDTISTRLSPLHGVIPNPPECFESLGGKCDVILN